MSLNIDATHKTKPVSLFAVVEGRKTADKKPTQADQNAAKIDAYLNKNKAYYDTVYGKAAAPVDKAIDHLEGLVNELATVADGGPVPFDFDDSIMFSLRNGIFSLMEAVNGMLSIQPQLMASEMAIQTEVVSTQTQKWSDAFVSILQYWEHAIQGLGAKPDPGTLATYQADMQVANADSGSSSSALTGVGTMLSSGISSKSSSYTNFVQQSSSLASTLLQQMTQDLS